MDALGLRPLKPKLTMSSVRGKIIVQNDGGERIGAYGGTECFLSRQSGVGPCLVVRSSRHRRHEGTFFRLVGLQRILSSHCAEGKLTLMIQHGTYLCTIFIHTEADVDALRMMAGVLQDRRSWATSMEQNVASRSTAKRGGGTTTSGGARNSGLRQPELAPLENEYVDFDDDDDDDDERGGAQEEKVEPSSSPAAAAARTSTTADGGPTTSSSSSSSPPMMMIPSSRSYRGSGMALSAEQKKAVELLRAGKHLFITGAAGTGKSEWLHHVMGAVLPQLAAERGGHVALTATTGVAARAIGGCTLHAYSGIGRGEGTVEAIVRRVQSRPDLVRAWRSCAILVVDEVSMLSARIFSLVEEVARVVRRDPAPFGGVQLVLVGDFLQLPPISRGGEEVGYAFESSAWASCRIQPILFTTNHRHDQDAAYARCCEDLRRGECTVAVDDVLTSSLHRPLGEEMLGISAITVFPTRAEAERCNEAHLHALDVVHFQRYHSEDYAAIPGADVDQEVSFPATLTLKVGAHVILLAAIHEGRHPNLVNGSFGVVVSFAEQDVGGALPIVRFTSGEEVMVPRVTSQVSGADGRLAFSRTQVPLLLAWGLTVHRVQGLTLPMMRISINARFFEPGQLYVALSRLRRCEDLCVEAYDVPSLRAALAVAPAAQQFYAKMLNTRDAQAEELRQQRVMEEQSVLEERHKRRRETERAEKRQKRKMEAMEMKEEQQQQQQHVPVSTSHTAVKHSESPNTSSSSHAAAAVAPLEEDDAMMMSSQVQRMARGLMMDDEEF